MTREEIIEECKKRLGFETNYKTYSLCQHEKNFYNAIIKELEKNTVPEEVYTEEYNARKQAEYELWKIKEQQSDNYVSRAEIIDELNRLGRNAFKDNTDYDNFFAFVDNMQPVIPIHGTCKDCKHWKDSDGVYRRGIGAESKCPINIKEVYEGKFYCKEFKKRGGKE